MCGTVNWPPTWATLLLVPALLVGFTVHELAHAIVAYILGDTSQEERKRLTFNPLRHVSWLGMVTFLLVNFGWAKPLWVDYARLRIKNRPFGLFLVSIAGATANLLAALVAFAGIVGTAVIVWMFTGSFPSDVLTSFFQQEPGLDAQGLAVAFSYYMVSVNLALAFFNMLPLPSLDGFQALVSLYTVIRNTLKGQIEDVSLPGLARPVATTTQEAPALSPAQIHFSIGLEYHKAGQWDEAIARYRQTLAQDEHFALAYYNQGLAYWAKGRRSLAVSAFRAAMRAGDANVRILASLRLQELSQTDPGSESMPDPIPPPLEPGSAPEMDAVGPSDLDPEVERRVWLRLAVGGIGMLLLAVSMWLYVTVVILASVG